VTSYLIKLGGGLITDKSIPQHVRQDVLAQVASELGELYKDLSSATWLIGNGAGSFGHYTVHAVSYKDAPADPKRIAAVRQSVADLNRLVVAALRAADIPAAALSPHQFIREKDGVIQLDYQKIAEVYARGEIPIVYGDVIDTGDGNSRIASTEEVLKIIGKHQTRATGTPATACVYATSVEGVLDQEGMTIPVLRRESGLHVHKNSKDYDVTGGMAQKVAAGFEALQYSQRVYIVDGRNQGHLSRAIRLQDVDTRLEAYKPRD